jgi:hypothetical protein
LLEHGGRGNVNRPFDGLVFHRYSTGEPHSAIRVGDYKLVKFWKHPIRIGSFSMTSSSEPAKMFLFNLKDDIGETRNVADAMPQKTQELHEKLMTYLRSVGSDVLELYK